MFQSTMELYSIIFGTLLALIILQTARADISGCNFSETVNLTGSQSFENGSYLYEDIEVPVYLTGHFDYITTKLKINEITASHLRGCVCRLKPCIWICCRFKDWDASNGKCNDGLMEELCEINPLLYVTLENGSVVKKNLLKDFIVLRDRMRMADIWIAHDYTFFENKGNYDCLHPNHFTSDSILPIVGAYHRHSYSYLLQESSSPRKTIPVAFWLSIVFLVLTIAVYLCVRKLRNLHGKCFIWNMIISFFDAVIDPEMISERGPFCTLRGYFLHFFLIAKFSWLLSLSHQLWRGLSSVNRDESEYSFRAYNIFAWGLPAVLTIVPFLIDLIWGSDPSNVNLVPGMGWEVCYFKASILSLIVYNTLPVVIISLLNIILFVWTIISILGVKHLVRQFSDQHQRDQNLNSRLQKYYLFLRLAVVMDIKWSVSVFLMFNLSDGTLLREIFKYLDTCFGIIIFVLFVLKRSTLKLLMESIRNMSD